MAIARRTVIQAGLAAGMAGLPSTPGWAQATGVLLIIDPSDTVAASGPVRWATERLKTALTGKGVPCRIVAALPVRTPTDMLVVLAASDTALAQRILSATSVGMPGGSEALVLLSATLDGNSVTLASANASTGLMYAILELTDRVRCAEAWQSGLRITSPVIETPANKVRSILRLVASEVEDREWLHDRDMWRAYLTMLAEHRFNRFSLTFGVQYDFPMEVSDVYFYFAYPFLLNVPGYNVVAEGLSDAERKRNLDTLRFIARETVARGIEFRLGLWTHGYKFDSPRVNYRITGITPDNHAPYCRDALALLLKSVPEITALTFRIHGESGIPEGSYGFWRTVFQGIVAAGRSISIDMHPKGVDQATVALGQEIGMPVSISPKYMGEHMGLPYHESAIRSVDMPPVGGSSDSQFSLSEGSRKFTRYSYGDFLTEDRRYGVVFRVWPGTQRVLLWGDPVFAAGLGRSGSFCGSDGIEFFEPLSFRGRKGSGRRGNRNGYADAALAPIYDWEKAAYTYRLLGRLSYRPETPAEIWQRDLQMRFGTAAPDVEAALASASRILPLVTMAHGASAANNSYWPEIYTNMAIVQDELGKPYYDTPKPPRFGFVTSFDPQMFQTIEDCAADLLAGKVDPRSTPIEVAFWLDGFANQAAASLEAAEGKGASGLAFKRLATDVTIQAALGRFFASKLRAGVLWSIHVRTDDTGAATEAIRCYRGGRAAWLQAAEAGSVYVPDLTFGQEPWLRGYWHDRIPAIDADLAEMQRLADDTNGSGLARQQAETAVARVLATPRPREVAVRHAPPSSFAPGGALSLTIQSSEDVRAAILHFRHVNQAEAWQATIMSLEDGRFVATIPAAYTDTHYPLQYHFSVVQGDMAAIYPGLGRDLASQPYFVLRQAQT